MRRAFTLIELLVVVAVIALLISILLPALGAAVKAARTVQCLSNIRQIGVAATSYATDTGGAFPVIPEASNGAETCYLWFGKKGTWKAANLAVENRPLNTI